MGDIKSLLSWLALKLVVALFQDEPEFSAIRRRNYDLLLKRRTERKNLSAGEGSSNNMEELLFEQVRRKSLLSEFFFLPATSAHLFLRTCFHSLPQMARLGFFP